MDYYIIQREEKDIDYDLADRMVEILVADSGILKIDAKLKINHFYGMLKVPEEKMVIKLSEDFEKAGLDNFILEEKDLVTLPEKKIIYKNMEAIDMTHGLIAAGIISQQKEQTITEWNPLDVRMIFMTPLIMNSGVKENRKITKQTIFYIDIMTRKKRWEISKSKFPQGEIKELEQFDLLKTYLTRDIRKMFQGQKDIKIFTERRYYNEYLTWLLQLVYANQS